MKFIGFIFLFFLYLFGPVFNSIGPWADCIFLISFLLCLYNLVFRIFLLPRVFLYFFILIPLFTSSLIVSILTFPVSVNDVFILLFKPIRILITLFGGLVLVELLSRSYEEKSIFYSLYFVFISIALHGIIMIVQFFNVEFKDFVYGFTTNGQFSSFEYNFRMGGLSGGAGGSILSVTQAIGIIIYPFLRSKGIWQKLMNFVFAAVILSSVLICGRSGILTIVVFLPLAYFSANPQLKSKVLLRFSIIILLLISVFFTLVAYVDSLPVDDPLSLVINRTLDTYINFKESGKIQDETSTELFTHHLIFPDNPVTLLIGAPENLVNFGTDRTLNSDMGYIRDIWSFGLLGAFIYASPYLLIFIKLFSREEKSSSSRFLIIFTLVLLFFNFKEPFFYVRMLLSIYAIGLASSYVHRHSINKPIN